MGIKIITNEMCGDFIHQMSELDMHMARVLHRQFRFECNEEAPSRCLKAMSLLRQARKLISQADLEVAMFQALGDEKTA